jgi:hypothetical protein
MHIKLFISLFIILMFLFNCSDSKTETVIDTETIEEISLPVYRVTSRQLRIRRGPGTKFEAMFTLQHNAHLTFIDKVETKDEGVWFLVQTEVEGGDSTIEGFVYSLHLEKVLPSLEAPIEEM